MLTLWLNSCADSRLTVAVKIPRSKDADVMAAPVVLHTSTFGFCLAEAVASGQLPAASSTNQGASMEREL